jgi:nitrogen fixation protein NifB
MSPTAQALTAEPSTQTSKAQKKSSESCGYSSSSTTPIPQAQKILDRIAKHPCYSEEAHHHYEPMHVAVAPACNIQCNYCNRKYDCTNESSPGTVL